MNGKTVIVAKLNVDENPVTTEAYQVRSIPLMGVFSGGELDGSIVGAQPQPAIMDQARGVSPMTARVNSTGPVVPGDAS